MVTQQVKYGLLSFYVSQFFFYSNYSCKFVNTRYLHSPPSTLLTTQVNVVKSFTVYSPSTFQREIADRLSKHDTLRYNTLVPEVNRVTKWQTKCICSTGHHLSSGDTAGCEHRNNDLVTWLSARSRLPAIVYRMIYVVQNGAVSGGQASLHVLDTQSLKISSHVILGTTSLEVRQINNNHMPLQSSPWDEATQTNKPMPSFVK